MFLYLVLLFLRLVFADVTITVNLQNLTNPMVSPYILGVNEYQSKETYDTDYKIVRLGGNSITRMNYKINAHNSGNDWYYISQSMHPTWQMTFDAVTSKNMSIWAQIPAMGWVAKTTKKCWSFSEQKYGQQQKNECSSAPANATWCAKDAGNGILTNGQRVKGNDPTDANMKTTPTDGLGYAQALMNRYSSYPKNRFVFSMDNEPQLWQSTHRDVHPNGASYEETYGILEQYAPNIKKACGHRCHIAGPSSWGWCGYFTSGKDKAAGQCTDGPDRQAHGNLAFLAWYLQQAEKYEKENGLRILDILDVHGYAQGPGVKFSCAEDSVTAKNRLQSPRFLYDPSYNDGSWIHEPIVLIPRLKQWVDQYYPETKVSISEYNFGTETCITSTIAHCEAVAVFADQGLFSANRWGSPPVGSRVTDAYRIYTDYDGKGNGIFEQNSIVSTVNTTTTSIEEVTGYGFIQSDVKSKQKKALFVMLFNKNNGNTNVQVNLRGSGFNTQGNVDLYGFDKNNRLKGYGQANKNGAMSFTVSMPAWSALLARVMA